MGQRVVLDPDPVGGVDEGEVGLVIGVAPADDGVMRGGSPLSGRQIGHGSTSRSSRAMTASSRLMRSGRLRRRCSSCPSGHPGLWIIMSGSVRPGLAPGLRLDNPARSCLPPPFEVDYLTAEPAKICGGWSRHWVVVWLWFLS